MAVPPVLLSHESTEHYTPPYIPHAVIVCMGTIDLDPATNSREIPNVPAARYYPAQDDGLVQMWEGWVFINPPFGPGVERWFSKLFHERPGDRTPCALTTSGVILNLELGFQSLFSWMLRPSGRSITF